jgi:CRP/FNR family transcriptional regulator, cyclic AMP receptor protein
MLSAARHFDQRCTECSYRALCPFANLSDDALQRLDQIGVHLALPPRAIVFKESRKSNGIFVVCEGQLKLSVTSRDGRVMIVRLAGAGDVLGLSAAPNDWPNELTAETVGPAILKRSARADFLEFLETYPEVGKNSLQALAKEYREVLLDVRRLALSGSASGRLARLLLDWSARVCGKPGLGFTMALTHEELAGMAGTSRETVTRLLNQYEREKLIVRDGSSMIILNPTQLDMLAG